MEEWEVFMYMISTTGDGENKLSLQLLELEIT